MFLCKTIYSAIQRLPENKKMMAESNYFYTLAELEGFLCPINISSCSALVRVGSQAYIGI